MISLKHIRAFVATGVVALAAMYTSAASAQTSATGTANGKAVIAKPITITKTADLDFGEIVPNSATDGQTLEVTVTTGGARSVTAGLGDGNIWGGTVSAAAFTVKGRPNQAYGITLPASAALACQTGGCTATDLTVDTFTESTGAGGGTLVVGGTPGLGEDSFTVGATLHVPAAQPDDTYQGTFDVIVAYQ